MQCIDAAKVEQLMTDRAKDYQKEVEADVARFDHRPHHNGCNPWDRLAIGQGRIDEDARWRRASARWLGHRLYAEKTLAVDRAVSLADARKVADDVRGHASRRLPALENLHVEVVPASGGVSMARS
jgi:hypothetical protein